MIGSAISGLKKNSDLRGIVSNFFSLYLNNAFNYIVPLIIVPYLLRVIGLKYYGYFVFSFAFATYFRILIDFGFDITLTRQIVNNRNNKDVLSSIFSLVLFSKLILFAISAALYIGLILIIPKIKEIGYLFCTLNFLYVISSVLSLNTFFYAFQDIKYSTLTNAIGKGFYLVGVFLLVKSKNDLVLVPLLSALSWIIPSVILFIYGIKRYGLSIRNPHFRSNMVLLHEAKNAFVADMAVSLYSVTNVFILGLTTPLFIVGIYGGVEKIFNAFNTLISSSNFALYPQLIKYYSLGTEYFNKRLKQFERVYFLLAIVVSIVMYFLKDILIKYLFGAEVPYAATYLLIFSFALIFSPFGSLYTRCLLILNKSKLLMNITSLGFIINFVCLMLIIKVFKNYAILPVCVLTTQMYICIVKRSFVKFISK